MFRPCSFLMIPPRGFGSDCAHITPVWRQLDYSRRHIYCSSGCQLQPKETLASFINTRRRWVPVSQCALQPIQEITGKCYPQSTAVVEQPGNVPARAKTSVPGARGPSRKCGHTAHISGCHTVRAEILSAGAWVTASHGIVVNAAETGLPRALGRSFPQHPRSTPPWPNEVASASNGARSLSMTCGMQHVQRVQRVSGHGTETRIIDGAHGMRAAMPSSSSHDPPHDILRPGQTGARWPHHFLT
jgi:hypothetical protein